MDLFDSAEKWSAYIELSNYREDLVKYLKSSLCNEIQVLANSKLQDTGWIFEYDRYTAGSYYLFYRKFYNSRRKCIKSTDSG